MQLFRPGKIAIGSLQTMAIYALRLPIQVALLLALARWLGPGQYGEYAAFSALAMVLGTISGFGLGFLVLAESAKDPDRGRTTMAQALSATLISGVVVFPIYLWLAMGVIGTAASIVALALVGLSELLCVPLVILVGQRLHGLGFVALSQALLLWPVLFRLAGLMICIGASISPSLDVYALVHCLSALMGLAVAWRMALGRGKLPNRLRSPCRKTLGAGVRYAIMNLTAMAPGELDKSIALPLLNSSAAGLYSLASRGMAIATLPIAAMMHASVPRMIRELQELSRPPKSLLKLLLGISLSYGIGAAIILYVILPPALVWLLGENYAGVGDVVKKMAFIAPFLAVRVATGSILFALGKPLLRSGIEVLAVMLMIIVAVVGTSRFGIDGLIVAVLVGEIVMAALGLLALYLRFRGACPAQ